MPNIYQTETWSGLPQEVIAKLAAFREIMFRENEKIEELTELDWETEF